MVSNINFFEACFTKMVQIPLMNCAPYLMNAFWMESAQKTG